MKRILRRRGSGGLLGDSVGWLGDGIGREVMVPWGWRDCHSGIWGRKKHPPFQADARTGRLKSALHLVRYAEEPVVGLGRAWDGVGGAGGGRGDRVPATGICEVVAELQGAR